MVTRAAAAKPAAIAVSASKAKASVKKPAAKAPAPKPSSTELRLTRDVPEGFTLPKTLAGCADELYERKTARLALDKQAEAAKKIETFLTEYIIDNLPRQEAEGVAGKKARVQRQPKEIPQVENWDQFYAHVKKTGSFELLQKRLGEGAVKERWANGKNVPGVGKHTTITLSVTKL